MKNLSLSLPRWARRKGLTLVEILVVSVIFAIIATSLFIVFKAGLDSWRRTQAHLEIYQNARAALDMMTRELSAAYLNSNNSAITFRGFAAGTPSGWASPGASTGSSVFFVAALNPSLNYSNAAFELCKVGYYMDSTNNCLMRYFYYVQTGTSPVYSFSDRTNVTDTKVADNITGFSLQFYDESGNTSTTWDSTSSVTPPKQTSKKPSLVRITLRVNEPNSTRYQDFTTSICIPQ